MFYEERPDYAPSLSEHLHRTTQIGWVRQADFHSGRMAAILRGLPRPSRQQGLNFWAGTNPVTGQTDMIWMKQNGEPYGPDEQRRPIFKCNEWTVQHAIPALRAAGVLRDSIWKLDLNRPYPEAGMKLGRRFNLEEALDLIAYSV